LGKIIKDHKTKKKGHLCEADQKDLVDILLGYQQPNKNAPLHHLLADENVKADIPNSIPLR